MTSQDARAEQAFRSESARHEKGSALELIAAETKAIEDKTARLRALRLGQAANAGAKTSQPIRRTAKRAAAQR